MTDRRRNRWGKWPLFAAYWAVQLPLCFFLYPLLLEGSFAMCRERGYQIYLPIVVACVMVVQAAFLLPVRPARPGPERPWSRTARCILAGAALGLLGGVAFYVLFFIADTAGLFQQGRPSPPVEEWWSFWAVAGAATVVSTAFFLMLSGDRPSALVSVVIAAFGAAALSVGIPWVTLSVADTLLKKDPSSEAFGYAVAATLLLNWAIATPVLLRFLRRGPVEDRLGRVAAWLFTGSAVEAAAVIPLDVMVRRKSQCYCGEGTLWMLTVCWGLGTLVLGPAVWLIPLARRRQRERPAFCPGCGYDLTASPGAERCPECGVGWRTGTF